MSSSRFGLGAGEQLDQLHIQQCGCDEHEVGGLLQCALGLQGADVADELIGDLAQRHSGHIHLAFCDQSQQQVEGTVEAVQADGEAGADLTVLLSQQCHGDPPRLISSRASCR